MLGELVGSKEDIFQSTPPRRRRHIAQVMAEKWEYFNPRLREGGDICSSVNSLLKLISIHASAKEATQFAIIGSYVINDFNPRLREGGDGGVMTERKVTKFQSTPPRRRRLFPDSLPTGL